MKKLLREGIIERAHGRKLTFCSPAHWVPKNKDETRFRLVTDLRKLNEAVIPDTSVFPTPARVMAQVNPSSSWFIVVDLLSGYHQVAIKEEDKHLFAFMIDEGKQGGVFVYTSAPMGFINSGHSFVNNLSLLLSDLDILSYWREAQRTRSSINLSVCSFAAASSTSRSLEGKCSSENL